MSDIWYTYFEYVSHACYDAMFTIIPIRYRWTIYDNNDDMYAYTCLIKKLKNDNNGSMTCIMIIYHDLTNSDSSSHYSSNLT